MVRHSPVAAGAVGAALALTLASGIAGLGDTDPYRHLVYAQRLMESGFTLRGHPFLPFTLLGDSGVDFWWGFHLLLSPFSVLGTLWGARVGGAVVAFVTTGAIAWVLRRAGQPMVLFALLPWLCSYSFAFRDHLARPAHLTIPLVLVSLVAGAGRLKAPWAAGAGLLHATLHLSAPLSALTTGLGAGGALLAALLARDAPGARAALKVGARAIAWSVGGLALGLLVRPDRREYPGLAMAQVASSLRAFGQPKLPHLAPELMGISVAGLITELGPAAAALAVAITVGRGSLRSGDRALIAAGLLFSGFSIAGCFSAMRFVDYAVPAMIFTAAMLWPRTVDWSARSRRLFAGALVLFAAVQGVRHVRYGWRLGNRYIDPPATFEVLADGVRGAVPPGSLLFTDDPFITAVIYASLPEYQYVIAYDPGMLYAQSPERFWAWHHLVVSGIDCPRPSCSGVGPSAAGITKVLRSFGAQWVITSYPPNRPSLQAELARWPEVFEEVGHARGTVTGFHLWKLREASR